MTFNNEKIQGFIEAIEDKVDSLSSFDFEIDLDNQSISSAQESMESDHSERVEEVTEAVEDLKDYMAHGEEGLPGDMTPERALEEFNRIAEPLKSRGWGKESDWNEKLHYSLYPKVRIAIAKPRKGEGVSIHRPATAYVNVRRDRNSLTGWTWTLDPVYMKGDWNKSAVPSMILHTSLRGKDRVETLKQHSQIGTTAAELEAALVLHQIDQPVSVETPAIAQ